LDRSIELSAFWVPFRDGRPMSVAMDECSMEHEAVLEVKVEDTFLCRLLQIFDIYTWFEL
jgi:hypothetical protein